MAGIPSRAGIWTAMMLIADPVMKPLTAGAGINSTIQPIRRRPMARMMNPDRNARFVAIVGLDHVLGNCLSTALMIWETVKATIATGPIETSLEVAKNYGRLNMRVNGSERTEHIHNI
jgi:DNA-directed RNA polymerase subunit L